MDDALAQYLRRGCWLYPQPVAIAAGRVLRSSSPEEQLDAVLRCGEVLTRYLAALSLASYAARDAQEGAALKLPKTEGGFSFGDFLSIVQCAANAEAEHPLKSHLRPGFAKQKQSGGRGPADEALVSLLELRNDLGHQLTSLSRGHATALLRERSPLRALEQALRASEGLLTFPLVLVEEQLVGDGGVIVARILWLMGDSADPEPREVQVAPPFGRKGCPYLGTENGVLLLWPLLLWDVAQETRNYRLFILDTVGQAQIRYKTVEVSVLDRNQELVPSLKRLLSEGRVPPENTRLAGGERLLGVWLAERKRIEAAREQYEGRIPWEAFDADALGWFAQRLAPGSGQEDARRLVTEHLLDGREQLAREEIDQLIVVFGQEKDVRRRLGRDLIDLRATKNPELRWDERVTSSGNALDALRAAVDFFSRHVGVEGVTLDGLSATAGTADYVAMREALVNLFLHQDYADKSAAAQIEIAPERAVFFNPGRSLVPADALVQGGKSQARNPLIARAFRLIGFAELAGSGLRELQKAWRSAKRRPPKMVSDKAANSFTLTLDWREVPDTYDRFWRERLGVKLTEQEATMLNLAGDPNGVSGEEAASAAGLDLEDAEATLRKLERQVLLESRGGRFFVKEHLKDLIQET